MVSKNTAEQAEHRANLRNFVMGFAAANEISPQEADAHWCLFSRLLSDEEKRRLEAGRFEAGLCQGRSYQQLFKDVKARPFLR